MTYMYAVQDSLVMYIYVTEQTNSFHLNWLTRFQHTLQVT